MSAGETVIRVNGVCKSFTMHLRGGAVLPVVRSVGFEAARGECVVLGGPSGIGKSSILKMIYGNYRVDVGEIWLKHREDWVDIAAAPPRLMLSLRRDTLGYVSQFLRAIPRISALDLVAATARETGLDDTAAKARAGELLERLALPRRLWGLPPATFSGGEQQRVNIARSFAGRHPVLLLDEPTASLDAASRARVVELIAERRDGGGTLIGVFHDEEVRGMLADRIVDVSAFAAPPEPNSPQP
jgi:alpha-D-ribose 1-methylphosphonate 5-triphosphate synthase subunit PhnL